MFLKDQLINLYLDWVNNYLTISFMAGDYGLEPEELNELIHIGRKYFNESHEK